jgi:uncharacterized HhH-GPD family protein
MLDRFHKEGTLTGNEEEDEFIRTHPNAALLGLLFDQRVLAENAFTGPKRLHDRLGHLDLAKMAQMDLDTLRKHFANPPAVHRFVNRMAEYVLEVAKVIAEEYGGEARNIWADDVDVETIEKRLIALPGFGKGKAMKMKYVLHYFGYRDMS